MRSTRFLVALLVVGLLGGTVAAFAVTEHLKLERSPVYRTKVGKLLGPNCRCEHAQIQIRFALRKPQTLTVAIVDLRRRVVRTLLESGPRPRGEQRLSWDGRDDAGQVVPAGTYKPLVRLAQDRRTILMPNPIKVDPTAPRVSLVSVAPRAFSPDGDGRRDVVRVRFRVSERARAILFANGRQRVKVRRYQQAGVLKWYGSELPSGRYRLVLRAVDRTGNLSRPAPAGVVRIRFVSVRPHVLHAAPGAKLHFRVRTDARKVRWRLGRSRGLSGPGSLVLRAPRPGRHVLVVTVNGHTARALAIVEPRS
jgi:hypothetical protein